MTTLSAAIAERGIDEKKEAAAWAKRARHSWKSGKTPRIYPGQTCMDLAPNFSEEEIEFRRTAKGALLLPRSYTSTVAQADLVTIGMAGDLVAEYARLYCVRNHLCL